MPLTVPAHQTVVLPLKTRWPTRFDGVALCIGSAAPDLAYPLLGRTSHLTPGLFTWVLPFTVVSCWILRRRACGTVFACLPDAGMLRLRSYRALALGRPSLPMTAWSAFVGGASHLMLDSFTHSGRWGAHLIGFNRVWFYAPGGYMVTGARALQWFGHTVGSFIGYVMFRHIVAAGHLDRWYGADRVRWARSVTATPSERRRFWVVAVAVAVGFMVAYGRATTHLAIFVGLLACTTGLLVAGCLPSRLRVDTADRDLPALASDGSSGAHGTVGGVRE
ncbi:MAG: DUF4184 family protein [Microthrixaceae bacterium]